MNNRVTIVFLLSILPSIALSQPEGSMTRAEFVESQIQMLEKFGDMQGGVQEYTDNLMKERMSAEQFAQYKAQMKAEEELKNQQMADCLGVSAKELASFEKKVGPAFQISAVKSCASKLPATIRFSDFQYADEPSPSFAGYTSCIENKTSKELGISAEKAKRCNIHDDEFEEDY